MKKNIIFLILILITNSSYGQLVLKKDSSKLVPFRGEMYYYNYPQDTQNIQVSLEKNHQIGLPNPSSFGLPISNIGSEWIPMLYQPSFSSNLESGRNAFDAYFFSPESIPYFIINKPLSELEFTFFGHGAEMFRGILSQNLSKKLNIGVGIKQLNNKGYFDRTATKHHNYYATLSHFGKKLETNVEFAFNDYQAQNYGSFEFDLINTLPQNQYKIQETYLTAAENEGENSYLKVRNRFLIIQGPKKDTIENLLEFHKPKLSTLNFQHELGAGVERSYFNDGAPKASYYGNWLNNSSTVESYYRNFRWFQKASVEYSWKKNDSFFFRIKGGWKISLNNLRRGHRPDTFQTNTSWVNGIEGALQIKLPNGIIWDNEFYTAFSGYTSGDFNINSRLTKNIAGIEFYSKTQIYAQRPGYFLENFTSKGFNQTYHLKKEISSNIEVGAKWKAMQAEVKLGYRSIQNWVTYYLNGSPTQSVNFNALQLQLSKELSYKMLYSQHTIAIQSGVLQNYCYQGIVGLRNTAFKNNLTYLLGSQLTIWAKRQVTEFHPTTMEYLDVESAISAPAFPILSVFATAKLGGVHISLVNENTLSSVLNKSTYSVKYQPIMPSTLYLKMQWRFLE